MALLIDDLSSEDPNAKINSIQRLSQIATLLGPERCVDELIPMLTELIDKIDCNPELMMALAEQLGMIPDQLGVSQDEKATNCAHLLKPLEIIAGSDDSVVQNKAIASLTKILHVLKQETVLTDFIALIGRLDEGDFFSMRIASCHLYAQVYNMLDEERKEIVRTKFQKLVNDDTPMVRWGSAQAMAVLVQHLTREQIKEYLLPLLVDLLKDKNDSVKVHAVQSAVPVAKLLDAKSVQTSLLPLLKQAFMNKQSWRLRFAVAENTATIGQQCE